MVEQAAETTVATPGSTAESAGPAKTPNSALVTKDRTCPFCHVQFTSSSLGRHLDLYIKERNPKPPDNIHDVNEIRKLRGSVTRRQARTSSTKREGSAISSSKPTPIRDHQSPSTPSYYANINQPRALVKATFNKPNWHQTGVINDLPPLTREPSREGAQSPNKRRRTSLKDEAPRRDGAPEDSYRMRATELALREVLDSVRAANLRAHPRLLFNFNWFGQSFPVLCLRCLSVPPRLLSAPPNTREAAWSLDPPRHNQYRELETWLQTKLRKWKQERETSEAQRHQLLNGISGHSAQHRAAYEGPEEEAPYLEHLSQVYRTWESLSEDKKHADWRFECQQAFAREKEKLGETEAKLDRAEQEIQHLRAQLNNVYDSQRPAEFSRFPPSSMPLSRETLETLAETNKLSEWTYEATIHKWKARIQQSERGAQPQQQQQHFLHPPLSSAPWGGPQSALNTASPINNTPSHLIQPHRVNNNSEEHVHRHSTNTAQSTEQDPSEDDEDLADALGDDDVDLHHPNHIQPNDSPKMDRHSTYSTLSTKPGDSGMARSSNDNNAGFPGVRRMAMPANSVREYEGLINGNNGSSVLS